MSSSLHNGSDDGLSRRSACDRCRGHKLRCERDAQQSCRRCLKARVRCTTGNALPTGRPRLPRPQRTHSQSPQQQQAQLPSMQLQPTPPSGSPSGSDCFSGPWTSAMLSQPLGIFNTPFLDGDFDFQTFLPVRTSTPHPSPPSDRRQECLQKLGDLHSALLADLSTVRASRIATESSITTLRADAAAHENCGCNVPIGRMLTMSVQLLDILHYFSPPASTSNTTNTTTTTSSSPEHSEPLRPDIPTTLSILACYAALRRIHRTIFACIDASLRNFPPPLRSAALPPLFPGLALGGFQLGGNVGLQVLIVAQLSESIMAKIDAALGVDGGGGGGGLVGMQQPAVADMLRAVVREEEAEGPGDGMPGGCRPLGEIIGSVKSLC